MQNPAHFIHHLINHAGLLCYLRGIARIALGHAVDGMKLFVFLANAFRNVLIDRNRSLDYLSLLCLGVPHGLDRVDRFIEKIRHITHALKYIIKVFVLRSEFGRVLFHLRRDLFHVILHPLNHGLHHS